MVLAMNIGNTNFILALKKNDNIDTIRYPSKSFKSSDDFMQVIRQWLSESGNDAVSNITGAIISSVNPKLTDHLANAIKELFCLSPLIVNANMNMTLNLSHYDISLIGSDRIAICEAAIFKRLHSKNNYPVVVFDFGTSITINVVDRNGCFLGGSILPGISMSLDALAENTAQLPHGILSLPPHLIGSNTQECLISGAVFGSASMLDGMAKRIEASLEEKITVLITGGNSFDVMPICQTEVLYEPELLIEGLYMLYRQNT